MKSKELNSEGLVVTEPLAAAPKDKQRGGFTAIHPKGTPKNEILRSAVLKTVGEKGDPHEILKNSGATTNERFDTLDALVEEGSIYPLGGEFCKTVKFDNVLFERKRQGI